MVPAAPRLAPTFCPTHLSLRKGSFGGFAPASFPWRPRGRSDEAGEGAFDLRRLKLPPALPAGGEATSHDRQARPKQLNLG